MIKSILFPTDFSKNAKNAAEFAVKIAQLTNAKLNLLHVYETPYPEYLGRDAPDNSFVEDNRENSRKQLKYIVNANQLEDHPHRLYLREGSLINAVEEISDTEKIDLIVMGQKGENRRDTLFGSICFKMIINANSPVLAVPSNTKYAPFSHITYLTDLSSSEVNYIQIHQFADLFGAKITLLHITEEHTKVSDKRNMEVQLSAKSKVKMEYNIILNDDLIDGVQDYINNNEVDLLVMKTKSKSIFNRLFSQNLTEEMLNYMKLPLLVFS